MFCTPFVLVCFMIPGPYEVTQYTPTLLGRLEKSPASGRGGSRGTNAHCALRRGVPHAPFIVYSTAAELLCTHAPAACRLDRGAAPRLPARDHRVHLHAVHHAARRAGPIVDRVPRRHKGVGGLDGARRGVRAPASRRNRVPWSHFAVSLRLEPLRMHRALYGPQGASHRGAPHLRRRAALSSLLSIPTQQSRRRPGCALRCSRHPPQSALSENPPSGRPPVRATWTFRGSPAQTRLGSSQATPAPAPARPQRTQRGAARHAAARGGLGAAHLVVLRRRDRLKRGRGDGHVHWRSGGWRRCHVVALHLRRGDRGALRTCALCVSSAARGDAERRCEPQGWRALTWTCPLSTEGWTRRVHFVREGGGGAPAGCSGSRWAAPPGEAWAEARPWV